tara:strand:- start:389 stop:541 length:153 start_codon:yes stop_codon:yes gene_type:complete
MTQWEAVVDEILVDNMYDIRQFVPEGLDTPDEVEYYIEIEDEMETQNGNV